MGAGGSFLGGKSAGREADHSAPSSAEVKKGGAIPLLPICLHGLVLIELSTGTTLHLMLSIIDSQSPRGIFLDVF
jgi:hypothetical protein